MQNMVKTDFFQFFSLMDKIVRYTELCKLQNQVKV